MAIDGRISFFHPSEIKIIKTEPHLANPAAFCYFEIEK